MTIRSTILTLGCCLPALALAAAAHAQTAPEAPSAAPAAPEAGEGDIVVTAQFTRQGALEVPMALTAYSGRFLDDYGITDFEKLSRYVPGFVVQNQSPNNPGFVIRGITSDSGQAFVEPRVSVNQDGVSISKARGSYVELFDIDRVEVAKGPQSTLYGRGALIGAVNIVEAKADPHAFYGYFYGSYGNFNAYRVDMTANAPITDTLAIRLAGRIKKRDGYVKNLLVAGSDQDFDSVDTQAGRASLRWQPGALTVDLIGNYQEDHPNGTSFKSIAYNPTDPVTGAVIGDRGRNSGAALAPQPGFEHGAPLGLDRTVWGVTGIANYEIDDHWSINALGSYRRFKALEIFDADGISLPALTAAEDARGNQTMETLRLSYKSDRLRAFIGGTYFHEDGSQRTPASFDERVALARVAGVLNGGGLIPGRAADDPAPLSVLANPGFDTLLLQGVAAARGVALNGATAAGIAANLKANHLESSTNFARTNSVDVFADATFHVTDRFELGGGVRYTHDDKSSGITAAVLNGRSILGGFIGALGLPSAQRDALLGALALPGAVLNTLPASVVPYFGLGLQPTTGNGTRFDQDLSDGGLTWRATARYAPSADASIYATYARGRHPKVLSVGAPSVPYGAVSFQVLPAETVDSYEAGVKTALADRKLFADGSVYYYQYSNFQTTQQVNTQFVTINAGKAESYGFEGQLRYVPFEALSLFATYAYNHGRFTEGARKGNQFRLSPDHAASAGFTFKQPVGPGKIDLTPSVTWQSKTFFDDDNDKPSLQTQNLIPDLVQDEFQNSYALVDARLGFEPANGVWRIEGFVTNLLNKKYIKDAGNTGDALGLPTFIAGEPRFYGISLTVRSGGK
ncbi:TonB-dependent receptor [Sphingomonas oligophenolica]|uniref:TonB-dependent receptor n=1 Tax=Sphingomonas oligophenolica TaxID=301154 RepID=A0ABU9Y1J7_9SPHN